MKIIAISDTHGDHRDVSPIPDGDVFIYAGDFLNFGQEKTMFMGDVLGDFYKWIEHLPYDTKILIGGNHDWFLYEEPKRSKELPCIYLQDASIEIEGFKIYGSPWVPHLNGIGSFGINRGDDMAEKWSLIPNDLDILITHSAPFELGDTIYRKKGVVRRSDGSGSAHHVGCKDLINRVKEVEPRLHIFGHIHAASGFDKKVGNTIFKNVAFNRHDKKVTVIDLERE